MVIPGQNGRTTNRQPSASGQPTVCGRASPTPAIPPADARDPAAIRPVARQLATAALGGPQKGPFLGRFSDSFQEVSSLPTSMLLACGRQ